MARTAVMTVRPLVDKRIDEAWRTLDVSNAPILEYDEHSGGRRHIVWQPTRVILIWLGTELATIHAPGLRLRKDRTVGVVADAQTFRVKDGVVVPLTSRDYPTDWLQSIVDLYGTERPEATVPDTSLTGDRTVWHCPPCPVGNHTIIREA